MTRTTHAAEKAAGTTPFRTIISALVLALAVILPGSVSLAQTPATPAVSFLHPYFFQASADPNQFNNALLSSAVLGDFNGDGKLDLLTADNTYGTGLSLSLGNGDGTFQAPTLVGTQTGRSIYALATGDFNGDKILDFVVLYSDNAGTGIQTYLGTGTGTFTPGASNEAAIAVNQACTRQYSLAVGDVNADGKLDVVAVTLFSGMYVWNGNGDGTFKTPTMYPIVVAGSTSVQSVTLADFNGDKKLDVAIGVNDGLGVMLNSGTGTFGALAYYDAAVFGGYENPGIVTADFNGDTKVDVATASSSGVHVWVNSGTGTFTLKSTLAAGTGGWSVAAGKLHGGTIVDIVQGDTTGQVWTWKGKGDGTFTQTAGYSTAGEVAQVGAVLVADLNKDGYQDLVAMNYNESYPWVALGNNDDTVRSTPISAFNLGGGRQMAVADFNGDGYPDVAYSYAYNPATATYENFVVSLGSSHGALGAPTYVSLNTCTSNLLTTVSAGDANVDGKQDILATFTWATFAGCQTGTVAYFKGLGTGKFNAPSFISIGSAAQANQAYLVDVNGDGKLDIVTSNADGSISVMTGKGNGTFNTAVVNNGLVALSPYSHALVFGDFNGDGKMDIAAVTSGGQDLNVRVLPGNGNGTFGAPVASAMSINGIALTAGDFNGDGKLDLVVADNYNSTLCNGGGLYASAYQFMAGNGNGSFSFQGTGCTSAEYVRNLVSADFNGDGKRDVAAAFAGAGNGYGAEVGPTILQGNGDGTFTTVAGTAMTGPVNTDLAVGDFNNDGMLDLAVLNNNNLGGGNGSYNTWLNVVQNTSQAVSVSPLTQSYGSVTVNTTKSNTILLTNDQKTTMAVTSITVTGTNASEFVQTNNCGTSLKAGAYCTVTVKFTPTATGARSATLNLVDAVGTQTVALSGTGK